MISLDRAKTGFGLSALQSMTGFGSASANLGDLQVVCDIRSVNGKNLDVRLRLPSGYEALETPIKKQISTQITRGSLQVSISVGRAEGKSEVTIDETAFRTIADQASRLANECGLTAPTTDGILAVRGVVLTEDTLLQSSSGGESAVQHKTAITAVSDATAQLTAMREVEGASLLSMLSGHLTEIARLVVAARDDEANQPEAVLKRLTTQVESLLEMRSDSVLDPIRLNAEAALLATKADIREEIDRLDAHVVAAKELLSEGGAVGRKLDFLAQEFNRETNTICSKSASATLTAIGLALKAVIEQFREQVQNLQ